MTENRTQSFARCLSRLGAWGACLWLAAGAVVTAGAQAPPAAAPKAAPAAPVVSAEQQQAQRLLQANDFAGAAAALAPLVEREPGNARAWRMFGLASLRLKEYDQAIAAYERSLVL